MKKHSRRLLTLSIITLIIFIINKIIFTLATFKETLYHRHTHYYQWKFGKIFYTVQGKGANVLLIHDSSSDSSSDEFYRIVSTLSKQYRVYTIDLIGYGRSEKPQITYTAFIFVQLIIDFRKSVIKGKTSIITSGKSNAFATMACYQEPDLFKNIIFINPSSLKLHKKNPTGYDKFIKLIIELPIFGTFIYSIISSRLFTNRIYSKKLYSPLYIKQKYSDACYEAAHLGGSSSKFTYASNYCHFNNVNINEALSLINNNIFIIQGLKRDEDHETITADYKLLNPAIECSTIDRTKLLPHIEKPEALLEILSIYLH